MRKGDCGLEETAETVETVETVEKVETLETVETVTNLKNTFTIPFWLKLHLFDSALNIDLSGAHLPRSLFAGAESKSGFWRELCFVVGAACCLLPPRLH